MRRPVGRDEPSTRAIGWLSPDLRSLRRRCRTSTRRWQMFDPPRKLMSKDEVQERVDELIGAMTEVEKAGQLTQYFYFGFMNDTQPEPGDIHSVANQPAVVEAALGRGEAGSLLFVTDPAEINRLQQLTVQGNRLGIPALFGFDVIHGFRTIFPVPIAMAASWDPAII